MKFSCMNSKVSAPRRLLRTLSLVYPMSLSAWELGLRSLRFPFHFISAVSWTGRPTNWGRTVRSSIHFRTLEQPTMKALVKMPYRTDVTRPQHSTLRLPVQRECRTDTAKRRAHFGDLQKMATGSKFLCQHRNSYVRQVRCSDIFDISMPFL